MRRGRWYRDPESHGYKPSRPRAVAGGLRADVSTQRGARSPWSRRFLEMIEGFGLGPRLARGRSYARSGQVRELEVVPGAIRASVQGTQPLPYVVEINVEPFAAEQLEQTIAALPQRAMLAAKLLAGELSEELDATLRQAGFALLPEFRNELPSRCSCREPERPCKHIAAVCYLFAAELERDPFLLLKLRGVERERLIARLTAGQEAGRAMVAPAPVVSTSVPTDTEATGSATSGSAATVASTTATAPHDADAIPTLPSDVAHFWQGGELPPVPYIAPAIPASPAGLLRRLGAFPFWRGSESLIGSLEPVYRSAAITAAAIALGPLFTGGDEEEDAITPQRK